MRTFLFVLILLEALVLLAGAGVLLVAGDDLGRLPPLAAVFRPILPDAMPGDSVRYRRIDSRTGEELGYRDYTVDWVEEVEGFGRELLISLEDTGRQGTRRRLLRIRPRSSEHGFLPPDFDEEELDLVPGSRPVIRGIRTAPVEVRGRQRPGFLVEAVIPREGLGEVHERYWMAEAVPVFGVARWERGDEVLVLHRSDRGSR